MRLSGLKLAGMIMVFKNLVTSHKTKTTGIHESLVTGVGRFTAKYSRIFTEIHEKTGPICH